MCSKKFIFFNSQFSTLIASSHHVHTTLSHASSRDLEDLWARGFVSCVPYFRLCGVVCARSLLHAAIRSDVRPCNSSLHFSSLSCSATELRQSTYTHPRANTTGSKSPGRAALHSRESSRSVSPAKLPVSRGSRGRISSSAGRSVGGTAYPAMNTTAATSESSPR